MTAKLRKRDLRTRVTEPTYRAVERYAVAHALTPYAATERLLMLGVNALSHGDEAAARLQSSLDSLDGRLGELTAPARTLLGHIHALVKAKSEAENIAAADYVFTRKTIRDAIAWSEWQVRMLLGELEALEYVRARQGTWGKEYSYQLLADLVAGPFEFVLTDPATLLEPAA